MSLRPQSPTPFPYTTLFRSDRDVLLAVHRIGHRWRDEAGADIDLPQFIERLIVIGDDGAVQQGSHHDTASGGENTRSEEHTSELQSRFDLVCRLLLEKKKRQ